MNRSLVAVALLALLFTAACGAGSPAAPDSPSPTDGAATVPQPAVTSSAGTAGHTPLEGDDDLSGLAVGATPDSLYVRQEDDLGAISAQFPRVWGDVDGSPLTAENRLSAALSAAGDFVEFEAYRGPGAHIEAWRVEPFDRGSDYSLWVKTELAAWTFDASCTYTGRRGNASGAYALEVYDEYACPETGASLIKYFAHTDLRSTDKPGFAVLAILAWQSGADREAADRVLQTIDIAVERLP